MIDLHSIADIKLLLESVDLECKLAAGRDGKGALPEDFWRTYSAFANTGGGVVLLGVREKQGQFSLAVVEDVSKVRRELFDAQSIRREHMPSFERWRPSAARRRGEADDCRAGGRQPG